MVGCQQLEFDASCVLPVHCQYIFTCPFYAAHSAAPLTVDGLQVQRFNVKTMVHVRWHKCINLAVAPEVLRNQC